VIDDLRECYRLLEVDPNASPEQVKRAYRDLVKVWHPDRFADDPRLQGRAQEKLKHINLAYGQVREAHVVLPPRPPPATASRQAGSPAWTHWDDVSPDAKSKPPEPEVPQRPKRNWEPALTRAGISFIICFQFTAVVAILWVIGTAFLVKP
jgi:hypothetical protein